MATKRVLFHDKETRRRVQTSAPATTTCAGCGRAVLVEHVDAAGRCVLCPTPAPAAADRGEG